MQTAIRIQTEDFDVGHEYSQLVRSNKTGACVIFTGLVRDFNSESSSGLSSSLASGLFLQHYPGMTERTLEDLANSAGERWPLNAVTVIHRVGHLKIEDQIVFVGVSSAHRGAAFQACEFIIDKLKTDALFWKKEGERWVEQKGTDKEKAQKW